MLMAELDGSIDNQLRYLIVVVPFAVAVAGACAWTARSQVVGVRLNKSVALSSVLFAVAALPVSASAMLNPAISTDIAVGLQSIVSTSTSNDRGGRLNWVAERRAASDLDHLNLPRGAVLVDDFLGFSIVIASSNPSQFVITSDRDFRAVLADPVGTRVSYILVPKPVGLGALDAVNRQYPDLYENGGGVATLVHEYPKRGTNDSDWRLYRVN
jgi:hypothetical protein